ncbi:SDR family oxidoreductase [Salinibacter altiplanensis]|uniref:SDR family oxidoreductase n=2 Tax=Salinibacter altiplanensis TaxID=1803181 RepID=UPI000C9F51E1|nr:SDR family oxidoreductase [Salinibacter altiplanensis]
MAPSDPVVLVTGATGFVGAVLTKQLVDAGTDVRIFRRDDSSLARLGTYAERVDHAVGDLRQARSLYEAMRGIDRVYHVAAKVSFARGDRAAVRRVNADGTAHVVNAALEAGVDRLVHTSSIAALGRPPEPDGLIDETTEWQGLPHRSAYARSKRRAELEVHRGIAEGLDAPLVNPSLVFGVGEPGTNTRRIVDAVRSGWLLAVPPGGTNVVDVRDVAAGLRAAMHRGETGRRYFLGGENRSWKTLATVLAEEFGVRPPRYTVPPSLLNVGGALAEGVAAITRTQPVLARTTARTAARTYRYDNSRARTELGCTFRPFEETARHIADALSDEVPNA